MPIQLEIRTPPHPHPQFQDDYDTFSMSSIGVNPYFITYFYQAYKMKMIS